MRVLTRRLRELKSATRYRATGLRLKKVRVVGVLRHETNHPHATQTERRLWSTSRRLINELLSILFTHIVFTPISVSPNSFFVILVIILRINFNETRISFFWYLTIYFGKNNLKFSRISWSINILIRGEKSEQHAEFSSGQPLPKYLLMYDPSLTQLDYWLR